MNRIVIAQVSPVRGVANPKPRKGCHVRNLLQAQGLAGLRQGQGKSAAKLVVKKRVAAADLVVKNQNRDVAAADLVENIVQGVRRAGSAV